MPTLPIPSVPAPISYWAPRPRAHTGALTPEGLTPAFPPGQPLPLDQSCLAGWPRTPATHHSTYLGTSAGPPPALGPCTPSSSPWAPPQEAAASHPGPWRGNQASPPGQALPPPTPFPRERPGSYLRRVSMMSCGRDMWCQCLSHGPGPTSILQCPVPLHMV